MDIQGTQGLSGDQIRAMVNQGGKFVFYKRCISIVIMTFNNPTDIYFIKPGESRYTPGVPSFIISLLLGWWGIPWGPIYTIGNIINFASGGTDVTQEVLAQINQSDPTYGTGGYNMPGTGSTSTNSGGGYNLPGVGGNSGSSSPYNIPGSGSSNSGSGSSPYNIPR
jgi:hypothetical protein